MSSKKVGDLLCGLMIFLMVVAVVVALWKYAPQVFDLLR